MDIYNENEIPDFEGEDMGIPGTFSEQSGIFSEETSDLFPVSESIQQEWIAEWSENKRYKKYYKSHLDFIAKRVARESARLSCEFWDDKNETDTETYLYNACVKKYKTVPISQKAFYCNNGKSFPYEVDLVYPFQMWNVEFYIAIEVDGDHNSKRDEQRDLELLNEFNVHTIRFTNMEVYKSKKDDGLELNSLIKTLDEFIIKYIKLYASPRKGVFH